MHLDLPQQFTKGTRRERKEEGFRYALTRWSKFMKSTRIKVGDTVHYSFDENDQVLKRLYLTLGVVISYLTFRFRFFLFIW
ncbi:hypothetical protein Hdeb2414_s0432g00892351 [Helianthus debilis subsp. tardiflorus]